MIRGVIMRPYSYFDRADLVDINSVHIDPELPQQERIESYLTQIKNPHRFLVGDCIVNLRFEEGGAALRDRLKNYFISLKNA